jgi:primosomal protein N' (replication factor Y)
VVAALGGRSLLVVLPTGEEVQAVAADLGALGGCLITVDHDMDDAAVTAAWARARHWGGVLVGTPRVSAWPVAELGAVAAVEESRRAMKDRQTPTLHVREILLRRAAAGNLPAVFAGPAPSLELMAGKPRIRRAGGRLWALVEVVDRREDPPGSGLVSERARQAIRVAVARGERVFVFAHRHGYSAASRCVRCRTLRRCPTCGSRPDPQPACRRCGQPLGPCAECGGARFEPLGAGVGRLVEEVGRVVDSRNVAEHPAGTAVTVGTERDLTTLPLQDLVVFVDIDGLVFGVDYRAAEEAFRIGTRLAGRVRHGSGRRLLVQTNDPDHPAVVALRRAEPARFHVPELAVRRSMTYPPYGALLVLEARGSEAGEADAAIRDAAGELTVLGPAPTRTGARWLVHGRDLTAFKDALRPVLQRLRDSGLTMRVDVDPIDL